MLKKKTMNQMEIYHLNWDDENIEKPADNSRFIKNGKKCFRQPAEKYTRVMGYFRPVSHFNTWKKAEYYWRTCYKEQKSLNSKFIQENKN